MTRADRLQSDLKFAWWTFRIFFFCSRRGKGESEAPGGGWGGSLFIENTRRGVSRTGGAEGPGGCLRRIGEFWGGGGEIFFFRGRNVYQESDSGPHLWGIFESLWGGTLGVILGHFNSFCVSVELGGRPLHKERGQKSQLKPQWFESLRFQISSGLNLKSQAIWASTVCLGFIFWSYA